MGPRASIPKGPPLPPKKLKKNSVGQILGPPQRWARVHCTPCTPYCYATGEDRLIRLKQLHRTISIKTKYWLQQAAAAAAAATLWLSLCQASASSNADKLEFHGNSFFVTSSPTRPTGATSSRGCYEDVPRVGRVGRLPRSACHALT